MLLASLELSCSLVWPCSSSSSVHYRTGSRSTSILVKFLAVRLDLFPLSIPSLILVYGTGWALTFPNVGWILCIKKFGDIFQLRGFYIWNFVMVLLMCATWVILFCLTVIAFWRGKIFMASSEDVLKDIRAAKQRTPRDIEMALARTGHFAVSIVSPEATPRSSAEKERHPRH